ncbi:hypothetical protein [Tolumonas lignilytica]|jgi:hypothetical protein|uniref:AbiTii domain-containing protein n=1 Tax=Tolumonas lignilytica TaxID=1283284 RepID=UPI000464C9D6|nr:hypothetical protein [Tolumonas lignilytica]
MGQTTPIRCDELLRQLEHLQHTAQDSSLLLWLQRELEGYEANDELPWYRIMECRQRGLFMDRNTAHQQTCQINEKCLCQRDMERVRFLLIRGPLSSYLDCHAPTLERWPDSLLREYSQHLIPDQVCLYAWKEPIVSVREHLLMGVSSVLKQYVPSMCREMENANRSLRSLQHRQWWV